MKRSLAAVAITIIITAAGAGLFAGEPSARIKTLIISLDDPDAKVRDTAIVALGDSRDLAAAKPLIRMCHNNHLLAYQALAKIAHPDAYDVFADALRDDNDKIVLASISGLVALKDPRCIPALAGLLDRIGKRESIYSPALAGLIMFGDQAVAELEKSLSGNAMERRNAAYALVKIATPSALKALAIPASDTDWRKKLSVIKACVTYLRGMNESNDAVAKILINYYSADKRDVGKIYAIRGLAYSLSQTLSSNTKALDVIILALKDDPSAKVRLVALDGLKNRLASNRIKAAVVSALSDEDLNITQRALDILRRSPDKSMLKPLCKLLASENKSVRILSASALTRLADKTALPALIAAADKYPDMRAYVSYALIQIGGSEVVEPLIKMLDRLDKSSIRSAIEFLQKHKDPRVVDILSAMLKKDNGSRAEELINSLRNIGTDKAYAVLIEYASDGSNIRTRQDALSALAESKAKSAVGGIIKIMTDENLDMRKRAISALGKIGGKQATDALLQALDKNKDESLFSTLTYALCNNPTPESVEPLCKFLIDTAGEPPKDNLSLLRTREKVIQTLRILKDPRSVPALAGEIDNPSNKLRISAIHALSDIKGIAATDALIKYAKQKDFPKESRKATIILARRADKRALELLITACNAEDYQLAYAAAFGVAKIDSAVAMLPFVIMLDNPDSGTVQKKIANRIKASDKKDLVLALMEMLDSTDKHVQQQAIRFLGGIGDSRAIKPLEKLAIKSSGQLARDISSSIRRIKEQQ